MGMCDTYMFSVQVRLSWDEGKVEKPVCVIILQMVHLLLLIILSCKIYCMWTDMGGQTKTH